MKYINSRARNAKRLVFVVVLCSLFMGATRVQRPPTKPGLHRLVNAENSEAASWASGGPYGGYINSLAMSQTNPDILYAGTDYGVYKTTDGAATWTKTGFPQTKVLIVQVHFNNPDIVYAGTFQDGIYKSDDGGSTWTQKGMSGQNVNTIAIDPNNANILYAGTGSWSWAYEEEIIGIFKSTDTGETWTTLISWVEYGVCGWSQVNCILVDPDNSSNIYAGGDNSGYCSSFGGFLKSTDGGETWVDKAFVPSYSANEVTALSMTPSGSNPPVIYAIGASIYHLDLYKSTDRGENWTKIENPYSSIPWKGKVLAVDPIDPKWVYVGTSDTYYSPIWAYNDDEDEWYYIFSEGLLLKPPSSLVINPQESKVFYAGFSEGGIYKYIKETTNWRLSNHGINNTYITDLAVHPTSSATVFAAAKDGYQLAETTDGGTSWDYLVRSGYDFGAVSIDPQNPSTLYIGHDWHHSYHFSIFKSTDNGQNWTGLEFLSCTGSDCNTRIADILINENNSDHLLVATTQEYSSYQGLHGVGVLMRTTDGGVTWDQLLYECSSTALAADPNNPNIVYSGKGRAAQLFKFTDVWGNLTAEEITPGGDFGDVQDIEVGMDSQVYVATNSGLMKWSGSSWTKLSGLPTEDITSLAIDRAASPETLYAGTNGNGVFVSQDGGDTWIEFNDGLENLNITKLAISNTQPKMLYAGTAYGGVWSRAFQQYTLTIASSTGGTTNPEPGTYSYSSGAQVSITATANPGYEFAGWSGDVPSGHENDNPLTLTMDSNKSITANFALITPPYISLSPSILNFGATTAGQKTLDQKFRISNTGGGILDWSISDNANWLSCNPTSGTGNAVITVSCDPSGLADGTYTATITISSSNASNSPQTVNVTLAVISSGASAQPFGSFDTPADGTTGITGAIPVTGWVLDDVEVTKVEIWRDPVGGEPTAANGLVYIGDSVFVEGARPDVEQMYPDYPLCCRAGWGYMILTNFLPNQGNGTYVLYAIAYDKEGNSAELGTKTITCDNANAVKPFGTIDTPGQGGEASGSAYVNFGWALTPQPSYIPEDGSTIWVYIDSVPVGHPVYNNYREDIATLFPGYTNSAGAVGFYYIDTTTYDDGVHTIAWSVADSGANTEGIGSRYFSIFNTGSAATLELEARSQRVNLDTLLTVEFVNNLPTSFEPIRIRRGYSRKADLGRVETEAEIMDADYYGAINIEIRRTIQGLSCSWRPTSSPPHRFNFRC